jgi:hypothetical protein
MTVKELKEALAAYPDETELLIQVADANGNTLISFFEPGLTPTKITDELNDEKDAVVFDGLFLPGEFDDGLLPPSGFDEEFAEFDEEFTEEDSHSTMPSAHDANSKVLTLVDILIENGIYTKELRTDVSMLSKIKDQYEKYVSLYHTDDADVYLKDDDCMFQALFDCQNELVAKYSTAETAVQADIVNIISRKITQNVFKPDILRDGRLIDALTQKCLSSNIKQITDDILKKENGFYIDIIEKYLV